MNITLDILGEAINNGKEDFDYEIVGKMFYYVDLWEKAILHKHTTVEINKLNATAGDLKMINVFENDGKLRGKLHYNKPKTITTYNCIYPLSKEQYTDSFKRFKAKRIDGLMSSIKQKEQYIQEKTDELTQFIKKIQKNKKKKLKITKVMLKECLAYKGKRVVNLGQAPLQQVLDLIFKGTTFKNEEEITDCYSKLKWEKTNDELEERQQKLVVLDNEKKEEKKLLKYEKKKKLLKIVY